MKTAFIKMKSVTIYVSVTLAIVCFNVGFGHAVPILDQYYIPNSTPTLGSGIGGTDKAQTFTVGIAGLLTSVEAYIYGYGNSVPLRFDIRSTIGGVPINDDSNVLASLTYSNDAIPNTLGLFSFDVRSFNIQVHPGEIYAIVLMGGINNPNTGYSWIGDTSLSPGSAEDPYALGAHFFRNPYYGITTWTESGSMYGYNHDVGFRTFVETTSVPEPSSILLFSSSLFGLLAGRRMFKR